jgi:hypothetical protein
MDSRNSDHCWTLQIVDACVEVGEEALTAIIKKEALLIFANYPRYLNPFPDPQKGSGRANAKTHGSGVFFSHGSFVQGTLFGIRTGN